MGLEAGAAIGASGNSSSENESGAVPELRISVDLTLELSLIQLEMVPLRMFLTVTIKSGLENWYDDLYISDLSPISSESFDIIYFFCFSLKKFSTTSIAANFVHFLKCKDFIWI